MILRSHFLTLLIGINIYSVGFCQPKTNYKFDHLIPENGFPAQNIGALEQDNSGNFWAISEKGLMFYNGHGARFYKQTPDSSGLLPLLPYKLFCDSKGLLWISYVNACVSAFDPVNEKFVHYFHDSTQSSSYANSMAASFYEDSHGTIWIPTWGGGLCKFDREKNSFFCYKHDPANPESVSTDLVTCMEEEKDGTFLVGSWEGFTDSYLQIFDPKTGKFSPFDLEKYRYASENLKGDFGYHFRIVSFIKRDLRDNLYIGTYVGVYYVDRAKKTISRLNAGPKWKSENPDKAYDASMQKLIFTADGDIWITSEVAGIMVVDTTTMTYEVLKSDRNKKTTLSDDVIRDIEIDNRGIIYVATTFGGVDVYDPRTNLFNIFTNEQLESERYHQQVVSSVICYDLVPKDSLVLVGHGGGLTIVHKRLGFQQRIELGKLYEQELKRNSELQGWVAFSLSQTNGIWVFPNEWLVFTTMGILSLDPISKKIDYRLTPEFASIRSAKQDSTCGYFWAAVPLIDSITGKRYFSDNDWICKYDSRSKTVQKISPIEQQPTGPGFNINHQTFAQLSERFFYIERTKNNFQIFDLKNFSFTDYGYYLTSQNFPDTNLSPLTQTSTGELWISGRNGLYLFNPKTGKTANYSKQTGLSENEKIQMAVTDKNDLLWIGVKRDLIMFNPLTKTHYRFGIKQGLDIGGYVSRFSNRITDDEIFIPVNYGLLHFEPDKIQIDTSSYSVKLFSVIINHDSLSALQTQNFSTENPILAYNENFIQFEFFSTQIYSSGTKTYHYRLLGLDTTWQSGAQNFAKFTNLNSGDYVFEVYCENMHHLKSATLKIPFTIDKPFWYKWWFITLAILVVLILFYLFIRYRERRLLLIQQKLEDTIEVRTAEVREKMNEIEIQKEIIEDKNKELTDSIRYAKRIQNTLLAHEDLLRQNLPEHLIFFKPKDIVSGDFYWAAKSKDNFFLAVCDSTGHGVPGAFMSLMNIRFLNEAIVEKEIHLPDQALNHVRKRLVENLSSDGTKDGMDGTLIRFEKKSNTILYASAHNSPLLIRNSVVQELPSDKIPIGLSEQMKPFNLQTVNLQSGDVIYFFTDGYQDQFGGAKGKKLKHKNLVNLLVSIHHLTLSQQKEELEIHLAQWKGDLEQLDDILVIGIKI